MFAAIVAASALGFSAPKTSLPAKPKLLALRGGSVSTDVLFNSQAALIGLTGLQGWLAPVSTLQMYGKKEVSDAESTFVRVLSGMNIMACATMIAAKTSLDTAVATCAIAWSLAIVGNVALFEKFDVPKPPIVGFVLFSLAVGAAAAMGVLPAAWAFNIIVPFLLIAVSIGEIVAQPQTLAAFKMPSTCSTMVKSLQFSFDMTKGAVGALLLAYKITGKLGLGLAAMCATLLVNVVVSALKYAPETGVDKAGLVVWGVLQTAIGTMAYLNDK